MKIKKLDGFGSYGTVIEDIDLNFISEDEWNEVKRIHSESLLTLIRLKCPIDYKRYSFLIQNIGKANFPSKKIERLKSLTSEETLERTSLIASNVIVDHENHGLTRVTSLKDDNGLPLGNFDGGELLWHSNQAGNLDFQPGVALMGVQDMEGTATSFVQTADLYESLPDYIKSELNEMVVVHNFREGGINPVPIPDQELIFRLTCLEKNTRIPLVIKSPSGIVGLHLGLNTFDYIEGLSKEETKKVMDFILSKLFVEKYIYDYWWENDHNILLFDNSITLHRRILKNGKSSCENRVAYRCPFEYDSLYGYYEPYFQKEFNDLKKSMDSVTW